MQRPYNYLDGLFVSNIFALPSLIPIWNMHNSPDIKALFEFAHSYLHKEVAILIFLLEVEQIRDDVKTFEDTYEYIIAKVCWGFNEMPLC